MNTLPSASRTLAPSASDQNTGQSGLLQVMFRDSTFESRAAISRERGPGGVLTILGSCLPNGRLPWFTTPPKAEAPPAFPLHGSPYPRAASRR